MDTEENKNALPLAVTENWHAQTWQLKEQFPELTDGDLAYEKGKENELLLRLESRLYKKRDEVIEIIRKSHSELPDPN